MGPTSHHYFCMIVRTRFSGTNYAQDLYNIHRTDMHSKNNNVYHA